MLAFIPALFWVSIPGVPLALAGLPFYEIKEFGAIPNGGIGWLLIVAFWLVVAFCLTLALKRRRARKQESANPTPRRGLPRLPLNPLFFSLDANTPIACR